MEKPMTEEAESKGSEAEAAPVSQDANDLFRTGGVDAGTGVVVGAGVDALDKMSLLSGPAYVLTKLYPAALFLLEDKTS